MSSQHKLTPVTSITWEYCDISSAIYTTHRASSTDWYTTL